MIKSRRPQSLGKDIHMPTPQAIEQFASKADEILTVDKKCQKKDLKNYKSLCISFSKNEFSMLEKLTIKTGRTKLGVIRWAILKMFREEME